MSFNLFKSKSKEQQRQIEMKIKRIEYVFKFGNGKINQVVPIFFEEDLDTHKFPLDVTIIQLYRQYHTDVHEPDNTLIKEKDLELKSVFFKGEYIPCIEAQALLAKNMLDRINLNKNEHEKYKLLVQEMLKKQSTGIIICSGVPYLAEDNTFVFSLNEKGQIEKYAPIESLEISASKKYQSILNGKNAKDQKLETRSKYRMQNMSEFGK